MPHISDSTYICIYGKSSCILTQAVGILEHARLHEMVVT